MLLPLDELYQLLTDRYSLLDWCYLLLSECYVLLDQSVTFRAIARERTVYVRLLPSLIDQVPKAK